MLIWTIAGALVAVGALGTFAIAGDELGIRINIGDADEGDHAGDATVTPDQAKAIAEDHTGGTAISVELNNEDGYLVYGVIIRDSNGTYDVKVDAGTGQVLKVEPDNDGGAGED
jgi:uncharacterized membrane protein YkoI